MTEVSQVIKQSVVRDAKYLVQLALELITREASPYSVDRSILDNPQIHIHWNQNKSLSQGGIIDGAAYIELSLYYALYPWSPSKGFSYQEEVGEGVGFKELKGRPYLDVLACLVAHEVAHTACFYLSLVDRSFGIPEDHGPAWHRMYRYLRSNLLFIVSHASFSNIDEWEKVSNEVVNTLSSLRVKLSEYEGRSYLNDDDEEVDYTLAGCIELWLDDHWACDTNRELVLSLSTLSVELMREYYNP